jgi:hypothetical protein
MPDGRTTLANFFSPFAPQRDAGLGDIHPDDRVSVRSMPDEINDGVDEFFLRSLRARSTPAFGRKQHAVLSFPQQTVEMQQSGRLQNDGGTENACRAYEKGTQTGDNPIGGAQVGCTLAAPIEDQELMPDQRGFGNNGADSARPCQSGYGDDQMNAQDDQIAHPGNGINTSRSTAFRPIWQFAIDRDVDGLNRSQVERRADGGTFGAGAVIATDVDDECVIVLVQREMESWRAPVASIPPIPPGRFAPPKAVAASGRGSDRNGNWFQKKSRLAGPIHHRARSTPESQLVTKRILNIRAAKHVNKQACRGITAVHSAGGCQWSAPCFSFRLAR